MFVGVIVGYVFLLVRSCLLITLVKCLIGHKFLGSLCVCGVMKTLIVSGAQETNQGQGQLFWGLAAWWDNSNSLSKEAMEQSKAGYWSKADNVAQVNQT